MRDDTILLGAVAYDPKVVPIWEGIRGHFADLGVAMDFALFSNYERQVEALLAGVVDVAWNTPLAHVRVQRRSGGRLRTLRMSRSVSRMPSVRSRPPLRRCTRTCASGVFQATSTMPASSASTWRS